MKKLVAVLVATVMVAAFSATVALAIGAPAGVSATATGSSTVKVSWTALPDASLYTLYVGTSTSSMQQLIVVSSSTLSYTVERLAAGTKYYFSLAAYPLGGTAGPKSAPVSAKTKAGIAAPASFKAASVSLSEIKLTWKKKSGATGYTVYCSTSKNGGTLGYQYIGTSTGTSYTASNLLPDTVYYFKVRAVNGTGEGKFTAVKSARTRTLPPLGLTATAESSSVIQLTWNAVSGATGYAVYRCTTANGTYKKIATVKTATYPSYNNTKLSKGTAYYYKVVANNAGGASDYSNQASATTSK